MSSVTIALNPQFEEGNLELPTKEEVIGKINSERENVINELKNKMNETKFQLLKEYLVNEQIYVPENIKTVEKLLKYVKQNLTEEQYAIVLEKKKGIDKGIEGMLEDLSKGSSTAFSVRVKQVLKNVKKVGLAIAKPLAINTVLAVLTPHPLQIFAGIGILAHNGYKIVKNFKVSKVANQDYALSKMIREMELTKDETGRIVDTRFSASIQEKIRTFLQENKIEFQDTGYISLMNAIYSLTVDNKMKICNLINNNMGNPVNIEERLKKYRGSFFERMSSAFAPTLQLAGIGIDIADTINDSASARIAVSTGLTSLGTFLATQNQKLAIAAGAGNAGVGFLSALTGWGADFVEGTQSLINKGGFALLFGLVGLGGSAAMAIWNYVMGKKSRVENAIENKKIGELDQKLYADEIKKEQDAIKQITLENPDLAQAMIISLVCEYITKKGIEIPKDIKNVTELVQFIKSLDKETNKDIIKFYEDLMYYNKHNHSAFTKRARMTINAVWDAATIGLAGLSLYDFFVNPSFLEGLNNKITDKVSSYVSDNASGNVSDNALDASSSVVEHSEQDTTFELFSNNDDLRIDIVETSPNAYSIIETQEAWGLNASEVATQLNNMPMENVYMQFTRAIMLDSNTVYAPGELSNFEILFNGLSPEKLSEFTQYCNNLNNGNVTIHYEWWDLNGSQISWNKSLCERLNGLLEINCPTPEEQMARVINASVPNANVSSEEVTEYLEKANVGISNANVPLGVFTGIHNFRTDYLKQAPKSEFTRSEGRNDALKHLANISVDLQENEEEKTAGRRNNHY